MNDYAEHYRSHLAPIYLWLAGGFDAALKQAEADIEGSLADLPSGASVLDLGCGFGAHALALARRGVRVIAIDTSQQLLDELRARSAGLQVQVQVVDADLLEFTRHFESKVSAILCLGDTLTHLPSLAAARALLARVADVLEPGGRFIATLRDYTAQRSGEDRFILARGDDDRLLTCFLEYAPDHVDVHDVIHERHAGAWQLRVSAYRKLRLAATDVAGALRAHGLDARVEPASAGMTRIVAAKAPAASAQRARTSA
jgi:SAM-dependent methyltransferase